MLNWRDTFGVHSSSWGLLCTFIHLSVLVLASDIFFGETDLDLFFGITEFCLYDVSFKFGIHASGMQKVCPSFLQYCWSWDGPLDPTYGARSFLGLVS